MGEIDDLLGQLQAEYGKNEQPSPPSKPQLSPQQPKPAQSSSSAAVDHLLAELQNEYQGKEASNQAFPQSTQSQKLESSTPPVYPSVSSKTYDLIENLQTEFQEVERQEEQKKQAEEQEKQHLESLRQQRKQQVLTQKAREWLKNLNPKSEEAKWFEEFSYSYDSKLQAAMDYLEALRETGINF